MVGPTQRTLVMTKRLVGTVIDWRGKFGWIQPAEPLDHPGTLRSGGKVFLSNADLLEGICGVGSHVSFFMYSDANGVGAMNVRLASGEALALASSLDLLTEAAAAPAAVPVAPQQAPLTTSLALAVLPQELPPTARATSSGEVRQYGGYRSSRKHIRADPEEVLTRVHAALFDLVAKAVEPVAHLDREWSTNDIAKRVLKYCYKAAQAPELLAMHWVQASMQFVEHAMQGYSASCGDKIWFFELDLAPALTAGAWELVRESVANPGVLFHELEKAVMNRYEELMDTILLDKAMWDAAEAVFGVGCPAFNKIFKYLHTSHEAAFKEARADVRPLEDLQRVEVFMRVWMDNSMGRAWQAIDQSDRLLTHETVVRLFQNLVAPFGEDHPFSCVPAALTKRIGRPPRDWPFIWTEARRLCLSWGQRVGTLAPLALPPPKRPRRIGDSTGIAGGLTGVSQSARLDAVKDEDSELEDEVPLVAPCTNVPLEAPLQHEESQSEKVAPQDERSPLPPEMAPSLAFCKAPPEVPPEPLTGLHE